MRDEPSATLPQPSSLFLWYDTYGLLKMAEKCRKLYHSRRIG